MRVLIVGPLGMGDYSPRILTLDKSNMVARAFCLDQALEGITYYDVVICAQTFPTHPGRAAEPAETQSGNWAHVACRCEDLGIPLVLVADRGGYDLAMKANEKWVKSLRRWFAVAVVEPVEREEQVISGERSRGFSFDAG